jgi:hypothetical protein
MDCTGCALFGCLKQIKLFQEIDENDAWNWFENHLLTWGSLLEGGYPVNCTCGRPMVDKDC